MSARRRSHCPLRARPASAWPSPRFLFGKGEVKGRALVDRALGPRPSAVATHDPANIGKADSGSFEFVHPMQPLKDPEQLVGVRGGKADPVVAPGTNKLPVRGVGVDLDCR